MKAQRKVKRLVALLITLVMIAGMLPLGVWAESEFNEPDGEGGTIIGEGGSISGNGSNILEDGGQTSPDDGQTNPDDDPLRIVAQPQDITIVRPITGGKSANFKFTIAGGTAPYTITRYENNAESSRFSSEKNIFEYGRAIVKSTPLGDTKFKWLITDAKGQSVSTNEVTLTVEGIDFTLTPSSVPASALIKENGNVPVIFTLTNTGTYPLKTIHYSPRDAAGNIVNGNAIEVSDEAKALSLAPGESFDITVNYIIYEASITAKELNRKLAVRAQWAEESDPEKDVLEKEASVTVPLEEPNPTAVVDKTITSSAERGYYIPGEVIQYKIVVTNTGNTNLIYSLMDTISIGEEGSTEELLHEQSLAPRQTCTIEYEYQVQTEDIEAGIITNKATVFYGIDSVRDYSDTDSVESTIGAVPPPQYASFSLPVRKEVSSTADYEAVPFTFQLHAQDGSVIDEMIIEGAGVSEFNTITLQTPDTYVYTVNELPDDAPGWTYDDAVFNISVQVVEGDNGTDLGAITILKGNETVNQISFTNQFDYPFDPPTIEPETITIPIQKIVTKGGNVKPEDRTFSFELFNFGANPTGVDIAGTSIATNGAGTYKGEIVLTLDTKEEFFNLIEGFDIREVKGDAENWSYSTAIYHVRYINEEWVMEDANGKAVSIASFTNKYTKYINDPKTPSTGDNSHLGLWLCLGLAGMLGMASILVLPKRNKKNRFHK